MTDMNSIGTSGRLYLAAEAQEHMKSVVANANRLRDIADAMFSMVQTYGYCPEVVDHFLGEDDSSYVVFECEEEEWTKFVVLRTDPVTGEAYLYESDQEGAVGALIVDTEDLISFLKQPGFTQDEPDPALDELRKRLAAEDAR